MTDHCSSAGEISSDPEYMQRTKPPPKPPTSSGIADSLRSSALAAALFSDTVARVLDESLDRPSSESTSSSLHQPKSQTGRGIIPYSSNDHPQLRHTIHFPDPRGGQDVNPARELNHRQRCQCVGQQDDQYRRIIPP